MAESRSGGRFGFALLTVLWAIVALSTLAAGAAGLARRGLNVSRNRVALARGAWAREACVAVLQARFAADSTIRRIDTLDLGRGTWCLAELFEPAGALHLNLADENAIRAVFRSDSLADAVLDWRDTDDRARPAGAEAGWYEAAGRPVPRNGPFADTAELRMVRGLERVPLPPVTVRGSGRINPNLAPPELLSALPGIGPDAALLLSRARASGRTIRSMEDLASRLPVTARRQLDRDYGNLEGRTVFGVDMLVARISGGVRNEPAVARGTLTFAPVGARLAVVAREME